MVGFLIGVLSSLVATFLWESCIRYVRFRHLVLGAEALYALPGRVVGKRPRRSARRPAPYTPGRVADAKTRDSSSRLFLKNLGPPLARYTVFWSAVWVL